MGCMYSKAITRSMSIREELSHGIFQSSSSASAWEELILTSHSGNNEHLFDLATKLRNSSFTLPSPMDLVETEAPESAPASVAEPDYRRFTRSKSCQIFGDEREMLAPENENKLDSKDRNLGGSRSFHTVEEYDALLERIHNFSTKTEEYSSDVRFQQEDLDVDYSEDFSSSRKCYGASENILQEDGTCEIGWKRKAIAKGLKSLDVSAVEFPSIARFRQRIHEEGQVCSPESYITPKFGSYNARITRTKREKDNGENSVFSPELVAAFEDCMQQLQVEEEIFLQRMDRYPPADDGMENHLETSTKHESLVL